MLFATTGALNLLAPDLRAVLQKLCIVKFISRDSAERGNDWHEGQKGTRHLNIDSAVRWCERFYGNRRFLFRGQVQPWPISSTMERITDRDEFERAAGRTQRFIDWITQEEAYKEALIGTDDALAVAQHHGLPTPLVDLTRSAPVAAFFATAGAEPGQSTSGVIYVFSEKEIRHNLSFADADLQHRIGTGVIEPQLDLLRRIRHQQGLFVQTRAWLAQDWVLAQIPFTHRKPGERIAETSALPREFIYPRPSAPEKRIYTYLLVTAAAGTSEPGSPAVKGAQLSFDSGGYVTREFLDHMLDPKLSPLPTPYSALDMYAAVLGLTCSHLYAHNVAITTHLLRLTKALHDHTLTPEILLETCNHLRRAASHLARGRQTGIVAPGTVSIRQLVDALAAYHSIRSGNPNTSGDAVTAHLPAEQTDIWSAYRVANHWLGDDAWLLFPVVAAFALSCVDPVAAFLTGIREVGLHGATSLADRPGAEANQFLTLWTGHDTVSVPEVIDLAGTSPFLERSLARLGELPPEVPTEQLGAALYRLSDMASIRALIPQFIRMRGTQMGVLDHDKDLAPLAAEIEPVRSLAEGLAGLETTMTCPQEKCEFHRYRICGRVSEIPDTFESCRHRSRLQANGITPELVAKTAELIVEADAQV